MASRKDSGRKSKSILVSWVLEVGRWSRGYVYKKTMASYQDMTVAELKDEYNRTSLVLEEIRVELRRKDTSDERGKWFILFIAWYYGNSAFNIDALHVLKSWYKHQTAEACIAEALQFEGIAAKTPQNKGRREYLKREIKRKHGMKTDEEVDYMLSLRHCFSKFFVPCTPSLTRKTSVYPLSGDSLSGADSAISFGEGADLTTPISTEQKTISSISMEQKTISPFRRSKKTQTPYLFWAFQNRVPAPLSL